MTENTLHISLLGPLSATAVSHPLSFRTDAERVLLAYLAAHQGTPQRRDTLAGLLSPDRPDKEALTYLRNRLTRLRKAIEDESADPPYLEIDRKQIGLSNGDHVVVDLAVFERLVTAVEQHPHRQLAGCPACLTRLEEAVGLVQGELLAGLNFPSETWQAWLTNQREHVQTRALEAMTWLRDAKIMLGEWTAVLDIAQRQLTFEPWLEEAHRATMLAHATLGDRNAALAQYEQCQQLLWEELGVEPEEETEELAIRLKAEGRGMKAEDLSSFILHPSSFPTNLPTQMTRFFGREREQTQLLERLVDPSYRLVTLVGIGGIGKTRLAVEVGQQVQMSFSDGVWFVPLEGIKGKAEQMMIAVGEAMDLGQGERQLSGEQVLAILRDKQLLLIFDNCETVLDALAFIPEWLRRAPDIAILATSREPLNFAAESVVLLDGLPTEMAEGLFAERARMAKEDFALTAVTLPHVRHICQLLDGSPLGISLAAAWVRRRSLTQIIDEIGASLDFLSTRLRDIDPRHRSMRAVFETSWQLLDAEEQDALAALAVFPGSFGMEAATAVANANLLHLDSLCEKSILQQEQESERYQLHALVRQFAKEKLGDRVTAVEHTFIHYFNQYAQKNQENYAQLQSEWANFSAAIRMAHRLEAWQPLLDLVQTLDEPWFHQIRFGEMREGLLLAIEAAQGMDNSVALAQILLRLGEIEVERNDYQNAEVHLSDALILSLRLENQSQVAHTKYLIGRVKMEQAQDDEAIGLCEDAMRIYEEEEAWLGVAKNLNLLALCQIKKFRDFESAEAYLKRSISLQKQSPPTSLYVETLRHLARVESVLGEYEIAEGYLEEATAVAHQLDDLGEYAAVLYERLLLGKIRGEFHRAFHYGTESLESFQKLGSLRWQALIKTQLALVLHAQQEVQKAMNFFKEGLQIFRELDDPYEQAYSLYYLSNLYADIGDQERSNRAKEQAIQLNQSLNDPQLTEKLNTAVDQ